MEYNYTYTFIIPHHNSPELLNRCLDSIPMRHDIQIIIVDDNSQDSKRPKVNRKDIELYHIDNVNTKGAGHARNVGVSHARGKWLLFPDCDDYYSDGFIDELDKWQDSDSDVIYFNYNIINSVTGILCQPRDVQEVISIFSGKQNQVDVVKFRNKVPWSKMVKKKIVDKYKLYFEEVPNGNDMLFSYYLASLSEKFEVLDKNIYNYMLYPNSLSSGKQTINKELCRFTHLFQTNYLYQQIGYNDWCQSILLNLIYRARVYPLLEAFCLLITIIFKSPTMYTHRSFFVDTIKEKQSMIHEIS